MASTARKSSNNRVSPRVSIARLMGAVRCEWDFEAGIPGRWFAGRGVGFVRRMVPPGARPYTIPSEPARPRVRMFPSPGFVSGLSESLERDLLAFLPELILCTTVVGMLLARLFTAFTRTHLGWFALVMSGLALAGAIGFWPGGSRWDGVVPARGGAAGFSGLVVFDTFGL